MTKDNRKPYTQQEGKVVFYIDEKKRTVKGVDFSTGKVAVSKCKKQDIEYFTVDFGKEVVKLRLEGRETEAEKIIDKKYEDFYKKGSLKLDVDLTSVKLLSEGEGCFEVFQKMKLPVSISEHKLNFRVENNTMYATIRVVGTTTKITKFETLDKVTLEDRYLLALKIEKLTALLFSELFRIEADNLERECRFASFSRKYSNKVR